MSLKLFRATLIPLFIALLLCVSLGVPAGFCQDTEDSQIFIAGFNAYQSQDYSTAIARMDEVLKKYPETTLRDMALFWLARAHFKSGHRQEAASVMSQFSREYPNSPLKGTAEEDLIALAADYERGGQPAAPESGSAAGKARAERERQEQEKAERSRAEEAARLAVLKAEQERVAGEKAKEEQQAKEKAAQERVAAEKAKAARLAAVKAEQERRAALQAEKERQARVKAEQERAAAEKAKQEQLAREKTERERLAAVKAEQERRAALQAEKERQARVKAEQERAAAEKAKQEQLAREKTERERLAAVKAEQERRAALQAEKERQARVKAEQELAAAEKAKQEQLMREKTEQERLAAEKAKAAEATRLAALKAKKTRREKAHLREKAIAQYQSVIQNYPDTKAAATASAKLRELGVATQVPPQETAPDGGQVVTEQELKLEVVQFAAFDLILPATPKSCDPAQRISIPFEITNRGNGNDSFNLESVFPAEYSSSFAAAAAPEQAITQTPSIAPGETFKGLIRLTIPASSIDGLRISYPIKASSGFSGEVTQSGEIRLTTTAPLLRAIVKTEKTLPLPGENLSYRVVLLNIGTTEARDVSLRLSFPPQLEPLDGSSSGLRQEGGSVLALDGIRLKPGESRELAAPFRLREDSPAGQEIVCRAELTDRRLNTVATFVSNPSSVKAVRGVLVRSVSEKIVVIPGQTVAVPFVVTNTGNGRDTFRIAPDVRGAGDAIVFHDLNRDGVKQPNEPVISEIGPLGPKEEASVVMEIKTDRGAADRSEGLAKLTFVSSGDGSRSVSDSSSLTYSRPVLQMSMSGANGRLRPGDVASFDLLISNRGSSLAKAVDLQSSWPEQLELVAAEPASSSVASGKMHWRFREVGAGEKRTVKVSFRVRKGVGAGASIRVKNLLSYEDQLGNRY